MKSADGLDGAQSRCVASTRSAPRLLGHSKKWTPPEQSSFDFSQSEALIESGYTTTRTFLSELPDLADSSRGLSELARPNPAPDTEATPEPEPTDRPTVEL